MLLVERSGQRLGIEVTEDTSLKLLEVVFRGKQWKRLAQSRSELCQHHCIESYGGRTIPYLGPVWYT